LTGFNQYTLSLLSNNTILLSTIEANYIFDNISLIIFQYSKAIGIRILLSEESKLLSSDNKSDLNNSNPDLSNNNNIYSSKKKQNSSIRMNIL
jgi:hypothetical protein